MKKLCLLIGLALVLALAGPAGAWTVVGSDNFNGYSNGALVGQGNWLGTDPGHVAVQDGALKIGSNATAYTKATWSIGPYAGAGGIIYVGLDVKNVYGVAEFCGDFIARDSFGTAVIDLRFEPEAYYEWPAGTWNFANGMVRAVGTTPLYDYKWAEGDYTYHNFLMKIDTNTDSTQIFVNGNLKGTVGFAASVTDIAQFEFTSWNRGYTGSYMMVDNLSYGTVPEPSSLAAFGMFGLGALGYIKRRRA